MQYPYNFSTDRSLLREVLTLILLSVLDLSFCLSIDVKSSSQHSGAKNRLIDFGSSFLLVSEKVVVFACGIQTGNPMG